MPNAEPVRSAIPSRRMSSRQIEVFRAVMIAGSLNGAAQQLHVSQPSLTRLVRRVEDQVGFALFDRVKGRLLPTAEARALFARVQHIQDQLDGLDEAIAQIARGETGLLRVGASPSLAQRLAPEALARFHAKFPGVPLHFDVLTLSQIVDYLALGRGESVLTMTRLEHPAIESRPIWPGRLVCILPASHTLAGRQCIAPTELRDEPLIVCEPDTPHGRLVHDLFAEIGATPRVSVTCRFATTAIALTEVALGIAVVDEFTAMGIAAPHLAVRPLDLAPRFHVHLNRGIGAVRSRFAGAFEAELLGVLRAGSTTEERPAPARQRRRATAGRAGRAA